MSLFYWGAALLVLLALVFALWPLLKAVVLGRYAAAEGVERQAINVALYRDHRAELERALAQSTIDRGQFEQLKAELERNLLADSQWEDEQGRFQSPGYSSRYRWVYSLLATVLLVVGGAGFYQYLGSADGWQLRDKLDVRARLEAELAASGGDGALAQELDTLSRQLVMDLDRYSAAFPDNLEAKVLLARQAMGVGRYDKAIEAYKAAITQQPEAAQLLAEMAQAIFLRANRQAIPLVVMLAERALAIQPQTPTALGLMGIAHFQGQQYAKAIAYWQQALALYPPHSPSVKAFQNGIAQARVRLAAVDGGADRSSAAAVEAGAGLEAGVKVGLKVAVSLAEGVPVNPQDTVFIYARPWQGGKMPLAIARVSAADLPMTLTLDDSMAMAPGMTLSSVSQVELVARLSPSGDALARAGDWQVSIGPVETQPLSLTVYPLVISEPLLLGR